MQVHYVDPYHSSQGHDARCPASGDHPQAEVLAPPGSVQNEYTCLLPYIPWLAPSWWAGYQLWQILPLPLTVQVYMPFLFGNIHANPLHKSRIKAQTSATELSSQVFLCVYHQFMAEKNQTLFINLDVTKSGETEYYVTPDDVVKSKQKHFWSIVAKIIVWVFEEEWTIRLMGTQPLLL